jgi:predicted 2-oxoglutarate/Fe(II)-dependent dioxygenase YbiX
MNNLFIKRKIISDYILQDLIYDLQFEEERAAKTNKGVEKEYRSAIYKRINPLWYLDYSKLIEKFCNEFNPKHIASTLVVKEMEYLKYGISDHFIKHNDVIPDLNHRRIRRFSAITMLSKTDDMEGGDLLLFDKNDYKYSAELDVGETVIFYSSTQHQVTPITCGGREVLVSWVYDRI